MTPNNRLFALAAAVLLSAPAAHASMAVAATFDDKVALATSIIFGKCVRQESRFDPSGRWIVTYSTFQIEKTMKGNPQPEMTVVTPGGQVGSVHQDTIGIPAFHPGAENVIFVKNSSLGPTVLYFDQGAYDVTTDDRGEKIVSPVLSNLVKIDTQRGMAVAPNDVPRPLAQFERDVNDTLRSLREQKIRMDTLAAERLRQEASFWSVVRQNKWTIVLALAGIAFATWRLLRH
ncbi:MAG: hypothetical protein DMF59_12915 [Acidobacteria bacterium]|nr:MAG: hypothetical protein DMF59_12915 [Acidobacteriota bacterium]